jgi:uncharacterized membrane protein YgaE (UPF0421/DUF939 family)
MALVQPGTDLRHSFITGVSCWFATILAFWLHCDNPWWAAISAWVISSTDFHGSALKALMRVAGTFGGYLVGFACAAELEGNPFAQAIAMFFVGFIGIYMRYRGKFSYAWVIGAVTAFMLLTAEISDPASAYNTGHYRLYEVIAGVVAVTTCQRLLGPVFGLPIAQAATEKAPPAPLFSQEDMREISVVALAGGLLPLIVLLAWSQLNLPSPVQIVITAFVTLDRDMVSAQFRATQRVLGCLLGGSFGLLVAILAVDSLLIWSLIFVGGIFFLSQLHLGKSKWNYVGTQGGVAFILALVTGNNPPDSIVPVVSRISGMICGVLILAGICFVLKMWQERRGEFMVHGS